MTAIVPDASKEIKYDGRFELWRRKRTKQRGRSDNESRAVTLKEPGRSSDHLMYLDTLRLTGNVTAPNYTKRKKNTYFYV